jgi:DNA polymerase-4
MGADFVAELPIGRFHGVGPVTEAKMKRLGIETGADLRAWDLDRLKETFGSAGHYYHAVARGIDERPVRAHRIRKSIGAETTFTDDTAAYDVLAERLAPMVDKVWRGAEAKAMRGRTVTLKLKFSDFSLVTRARSLPAPVPDRDSLERIGLELLRGLFPLRRTARLIGVSLSGFTQEEAEAPQQLGLGL